MEKFSRFEGKKMKRRFVFVALLIGWQLCVAQEVLIANVRIIDGLGNTIESGNIVISDGRIITVTEDEIDPGEALVIDATGMSVMPGMINTHWHLFAGSAASSDAELEQYLDDAVTGALANILERGVTTIMSPGDHLAAILDVREKLASGELRGPRLLAVGPVFTSSRDWPTQICAANEDCNAMLNAVVMTTEEARAKVREVAEAGVDAIKLVYDDIIAPDVRIDDDVVAAIADEANQYDLRVFAHVSSTEVSASRLVQLGVRGFVHSSMALGDAVERMRDLHIPVITTASVAVGLNERHRMADPDYVPAAADYLNLSLANVRTLWDAGVAVAFGTDSVAGPPGNVPGFFDTTASGEGLFLAEVRALNRVLSNDEVIISLTSNAARFLGLDDVLGTLEPGKIADIVIIDGNPLTDITDLERVRVVIQGGRIVVDKR